MFGLFTTKTALDGTGRPATTDAFAASSGGAGAAAVVLLHPATHSDMTNQHSPTTSPNCCYLPLAVEYLITSGSVGHFGTFGLAGSRSDEAVCADENN